MHITTEQTLEICLTDVVLIEVEAMVPGTEPGDWCGRTLRFTTNEGEILAVTCEAGGEASLQLQHVKKLPPAAKRRARKRSWVRPELYKPK